MSLAYANIVVMKDLTKVTAKGLYSTNTKGKPMTTNTFYFQINKNLQVSNNLMNVASIGFYKAGQLLNKAKIELKADFGKLKKRLAEDGLHIKQQERYMKIARNKNIQLNYNKLPPQWTFWEKLSTLSDEQFSKVSKLIHKEAKWKDIELYFGKAQKINASNTSINDRDNRTEIFGLEVNQTLSKKDKKSLEQLKKDIKKLSTKYKFIKLKPKNYLDEVTKFLSSKTVADDTTKTDVKFKKQYSTKKKIDL